MGTLGRRYKLWWSGNDTGFGGIEILVKDKWGRVMETDLVEGPVKKWFVMKLRKQCKL